jgi:hypothetical protein
MTYRHPLRLAAYEPTCKQTTFQHFPTTTRRADRKQSGGSVIDDLAQGAAA